MHWTFHRSFHHGYLPPRARGFTAFFQARNFSSSEDRLQMCFDSSHKRGRKFSSLYFCSFIAVDWSIQIAPFHNRVLSVAQNAVVRWRVGNREYLSIVCRHRCCGRNKQIFARTTAVLWHPRDDAFYEQLLTLTSPHQPPLHDILLVDFFSTASSSRRLFRL